MGAIWWWQARSPTEKELQVLFLAEDGQGVVQLFQMSMDGTAVSQLTDMTDAITGYAPSPDGAHIAVVTGQTALGNETIWLLDGNGRSAEPLFICTAAACQNPTWAPDSRRLLYERRELDAAGAPGWPRLWWLDTVTQDTEPLLTEDRFSAAGRLSPDGQWIAYYSPPDEGVWAYNFVDGRSHFVTSEQGVPVAWHPDGQSFLYTAFNTVNWPASGDEHSADEHRHNNLATHLFLFDLAADTSEQVSADVVIEDSAPAWSPDGQWIAFGRRQMRTAAGRQVWLMQADGYEAEPLTDDPALTAGPPHWSPDGRFLLFQRYNLDDPDADPGIWFLEIATGQLTEIAHPGFLPTFR